MKAFQGVTLCNYISVSKGAWCSKKRRKKRVLLICIFWLGNYNGLAEKVKLQYTLTYYRNPPPQKKNHHPSIIANS